MMKSTIGPILVVEDDDLLREAMVVELESHGFPVRTATNGEEALFALQRSPRPSLIMLDLMMPVMDGWKFRAHQLEDPDLASIPVIVLSARGDADRQGRALGVAGALSKPVDLDRLHEVLDQSLGT